MAYQSSTMAGAHCFSGHGLLECGLDPHKGTLCRCADPDLGRRFRAEKVAVARSCGDWCKVT